MKDLETNQDGDLVLNQTAGDFAMVLGVDELAQKVSHLLNINHGEINWNQKLGLNQRELLLDSNNPSVINSIVHNYLSRVFGSYFKDSFVTNTKRRDRAVNLSMRVSFNTYDTPLHINTNLEIGGD